MKYIILVLDSLVSQKPLFWCENFNGYTTDPFTAGHFIKADIDAMDTVYNDGVNSIAIPLTYTTLHNLGFKCSFDKEKLQEFIEKNKASK